MKFIPYGHQLIEEDDITAVTEVLRSDWLTTGPKVGEFERNLCSYIGCNHAVAVNSGTSALDIAVQALRIPAGSEVISTPFTFAATNNAILYNQLIPVFADIDRVTRNVNPREIRKRITPKTRAIIYVDYAGHPCRIDEIREIAEENGLWLIEDACHALGASYKGKKIGNFADMTIFSFHPVKPITTGEGGAVVTDNGDLAGRMELLRNHGIIRDARNLYGDSSEWAYDICDLGRNYRMTDIQAGLGISQLNKIERFNKRRNELAGLYRQYLKDMRWLELPESQEGIIHAWHLFTVLIKKKMRNKVYMHMKRNNIGTQVHYIPTYRFTYYKQKFPLDIRQYPVTEEVFQQILSLPLYPGLEEEDIEYISDTMSLMP